MTTTTMDNKIIKEMLPCDDINCNSCKMTLLYIERDTDTLRLYLYCQTCGKINTHSYGGLDLTDDGDDIIETKRSMPGVS